jgi:hypothetical protein
MIANSAIQRCAVAALVALCPALWAQEERIPLANVPPTVIAAAKAALEGFQISSAEIEVEDGQTVYELEGTADGMDYEVEVSADGRVLEVEVND